MIFLECQIRHPDLEILDKIEYYISIFVINLNNIQHIALSGNNVVLHSGAKESIFSYANEQDALKVYKGFLKALEPDNEEFTIDLSEFGYIRWFEGGLLRESK